VSDLAKNVNLTRITVPISYVQPLRAKINTLEEKLLEEGLNESQIEEKKNLLEKSWKSEMDSIGIRFLGEALVSHSAQKIYLIDLGGRLSDSVFSSIPSYLKSRIERVDKNQKISKSISEMLDPIADDLGPIWEKVRKQNGKSPHDFEGHEHGYCLLREFLTTVAIAAKFETEADANLEIVRASVDRIRQQIRSAESQALLARIDGILKCYPISIQIPCIKPIDQRIPQDLLRDLLDDSKMISLSESRYLLGIPGKFEIAIIRIRRKLRDILSQPRNRRNLALAAKLGNLATKQVNMELPEIGVEYAKTFSPPLVSLDEVKPLCLSTVRELLDTKPPKL